MKSTLHIQNLGAAAYTPTLELQKRLVDKVKKINTNADDAYLLLLEHDPPVVTLGRRGKDEDFRISRDEFARRGIEIHEASRGGEVTYHGPGQLVGYPIMRIDRRGRDVRGYVRNLEETVIRLLGKFDIPAIRRKGLTGVWVGDDYDAKIAAIGVAVHRWTTYHGFALNVCTDMSNFELFVPCGITDKSVTSMREILSKKGRDITVEQVKPLLIETFCEVFKFDNVVTDAK
ncbi:MAG: lipoyl(octanoyl) transferase LipB [Phycisphaerae bacterium]|nr:lipoyl(octanoyl) transferase LipB [Phycisphaerae bacterium]